MRRPMVLTTAVTLVTSLLQFSPVLASRSTISEAECRSLRQRLAGHARLSEGVRRAVMAQAAAVPPAPAEPAGSSARAEAIRARLEQIARDRQTLEEQRLGALMKFEIGRAGRIQSEIQALDAEQASLTREQAAMTAGPSGSVPPTAPASDPTARIQCQDLPVAVDEAARIRRRELGAGEDQTGAVPLVLLQGSTAEQIARELASQFAAGAAATTQIGLMDADGNGRLDGFVDVPAPGLFRFFRQRTDGTLGLDVFRAGGAEAASAYGELTRRLDETTVREAGTSLSELLATRPVGPVRARTQTGRFEQADARWQAGDFLDATRHGATEARSAMFENVRGQTVRVLELIGPVDQGVSRLRMVVLTRPDEQELWEETTTIVRPVSYWRTDVEVTRRRQTRQPGGAPVGSPSVSGPITFALER